MITGANSGIGLIATKLFLQEGVKVVGASRGIDMLQSIDSENLVAASIDLSNPEGAESLIQTAIDSFGRLTFLSTMLESHLFAMASSV
ncbi:SDR family NAD(P)-dependent oxidoreductase [Paenibacillus rhizosphaerae]|uniref:SDR family NAD(P)-dependent oxidoreductase n=1 Tax=Paenibacillus rhizosphaerae TaxID=297318 RepID=UPI001613A912